MRALRLPIVWTLAATVAATANLTTLIAETPQCTLECLAEILPTTNCTLFNLAPCTCTNNTIQASLSKCVFSTCSTIDQGKSSVASQQMCAGYPIQTRGPQTLILSMTFFGFTALFVGLRVLSRQLVAGQLFMDDYAAIASFFFIIVSVALYIAFDGKGFGLHIWDVSVKEEKPVLKVWFVSQQIYIQTQTWARASLIFLYLRLFPSREFHRFCYLALAFLACHSISFTLTCLFQCIPVHSFWDLSVPGKCIHETAVAYAGAGITIFEDIVFLLMPLSQLKGLQITRAQKLSLMGLFSVGIFATVTSIIRLKYLSLFSHAFDITWDNASVLEWGIIETDVFLICSCLPAVRPLYIRYMPHVYRFTQRTFTAPMGTYMNRIWPTTVQPAANSWVELNEKKNQSSSDENPATIEKALATRPTKGKYAKNSVSKSQEALTEEKDTGILVTQVRDLEDEVSDLKRNLEADCSSDEDLEFGLNKNAIMGGAPAIVIERSRYLTQEANELRARIRALQAELAELRALDQRYQRRRRTMGG